MNEFVQVDFKYNGVVATIKLYSKYSRIIGDSGKNKSEFVHFVNKFIIMGHPDFSYSVSNGFKLICVRQNTNLKDCLDKTNTVFLLDDCAMRSASLVNQLLNTNNLFIFVGRSTSICGTVPLIGTYTLKVAGEWFNLNRVELPLYTKGTPVDKLLVEAEAYKSEHTLLSVHRNDTIQIFDQRNLLRSIRETSGVKLVLLDLSNVDAILPRLLKYTSTHNDVYFYDYQAFKGLRS